MQIPLKQVETDYIFRYTVEYLIGLYALFAAQIKWHYPHLVDNEYIYLRDHIMHGRDHGYAFHLQEQGIETMQQQIEYISKVKVTLLEQLQKETTRTET